MLRRYESTDDTVKPYGEKMQDTTENKAIDRFAPCYHTEAAITCQPFTSSGTLRASNGVLRNFSCNWSYIETSCELKPGIIHMTRCPPLPFSLAAEEGLRTICLAEIKWRQNLSDANPIRFGMGVRYLD